MQSFAGKCNDFLGIYVRFLNELEVATISEALNLKGQL